MKIVNKILDSFGLFIRKDKIKSLLDRARKEERELVVKEYQKKMDVLRNDLEEKFFLELQSKEAEIESLGKRMQEAEKKVENAKEVYYFCWEKIKKVSQLISDVKFRAKKFLSSSGEVFQNILSITDDIEDVVEDMYSKDGKNKKLLDI